ncbi:uncharacterized protein B0I36DRAFT_160100 [Microdochium trichocladiopsis]|uniref:Homeobox domain-containing protein n=1 Tax=Microdochium trichocladiopsis TaxID=1682393 RepID=A0A9P8Y0P3_9PEZI|nr:uncharacterized protein B0I36DRAFT_160100 [Microdochium trichocladiopsis]KAH7026568.1 hypothetical protein B0I36DRAFT_160100 [Microdochium trichocladiopsis]
MNMQYGTPSGFGPIFNFPGNPGTGYQYSETQFSGHPGFGLQYLYPFQDQRSQLMSEHSAVGDSKSESKPRLSKEEVDKLEKIFQENPKPSSSVKAQLADELGLERPRINNWFQNRRAKAKQEKRQEEYEARRMAEKDLSSSSTPLSHDENATAGARPSYFAEPVPQRMNPSTALFPDFEPVEEEGSADGAAADDYAKDFSSHNEMALEGSRAPFQSLPALDMQAAHVQMSSFSPESISSPNFASSSTANYPAFMNTGTTLQQMKDSAVTPNHGLPSPEEDDTVSEAALRAQYNRLQTRSYSTSMASPAHGELIMPRSFGADALDSFKSPPPPANLASRRKIPRPVALQTASLKSRALGPGTTPKTVLDGSRRLDPSSPATAMRRIVSATGNMPGRIQKSTATPRSPMFFGRNSEALLQYHTRSPASSVGPLTSPFSAAPTTPMTPAVLGMQPAAEPAVNTTVDDDAFLMDSNTPMGLPGDFRANIKTPPGTPGLIMHSAAHFPLQNFASNSDLVDQPLLTPFFQSGFPDLHTREMPSYVDLSGSSLPATPLYPNMSMVGQTSLAAQTHGATQFDWDANESVTSSRSSPDLSRSHIHFIQNMTPNDYSIHDR